MAIIVVGVTEKIGDQGLASLLAAITGYAAARTVGGADSPVLRLAFAIDLGKNKVAWSKRDLIVAVVNG